MFLGCGRFGGLRLRFSGGIHIMRCEWFILAVLSGVLLSCAASKDGGQEVFLQQAHEDSSPALTDVDRQILGEVVECLMPVAEGRARLVGGVKGEVDVVLNSAILEALCDAECVAGLIGGELMEEYDVAVQAMERRAGPDLSWSNSGTDWLCGKPWRVYPSNHLPRGYPPSWDWLLTYFPEAEAYMALSLPGVDQARGLAVVRFVAGPSAHGFDGLVLLRLQDSAWRCSHVPESPGF